MSEAQKAILEKFSETLGRLPEKDQAYLLGRAEGMADAMDASRANDQTEDQ